MLPDKATACDSITTWKWNHTDNIARTGPKSTSSLGVISIKSHKAKKGQSLFKRGDVEILVSDLDLLLKQVDFVLLLQKLLLLPRDLWRNTENNDTTVKPRVGTINLLHIQVGCDAGWEDAHTTPPWAELSADQTRHFVSVTTYT